MRKAEVKRQLLKLILKRGETDYEIKKIVWEYFYPGKKMPDSIPYKKWIREEFGLVI